MMSHKSFILLFTLQSCISEKSGNKHRKIMPLTTEMRGERTDITPGENQTYPGFVLIIFVTGFI